MAELEAIILTLYISAGLLFVALAIPLIQRRIGPNRWYGFRVRRTLEDPAVWYDANEYAGHCFLWCGIVTSTTCLALYFVPGIEPVVYPFLCVGVMLISLAVSVILSFRFLDRLTS